jgi:hypothetical protein
MCVVGLVRRAPIDREQRGEHGASGHAVAGREITAVRPHDALGDGESQARPSSLAIARCLPTVEGCEQVR